MLLGLGVRARFVEGEAEEEEPSSSVRLRFGVLRGVAGTSSVAVEIAAGCSVGGVHSVAIRREGGVVGAREAKNSNHERHSSRLLFLGSNCCLEALWIQPNLPSSERYL